ncbi:MAG: M48 family metalloprotease [Planctomycetota bacterium]|jgi:predicted Zn-dependent protease
MNPDTAKRPILLLVTCTLSLTSCRTPPSEWLLQPVEADRKLGAKVSRQVKEQIGIVDDPELTSYLDAVGQRLTSQIADQRFDYRFQIVDQQEPNAFAAPGGYVYVSRGLLSLANAEDELANVLGHEISHVGRRHTAKQLAKGIAPKLLSLPGKAVGRVVSRDLGRLLNAPVSVFGTAFIASYSRRDELEADDLGQQLAAKAGYDPTALAAILNRIENHEQLQTGTRRRASFFDTHPTTPRRVAGITAHAETVERTPQPGIAPEHAEFLQRLDGLLVGDNPANGVFHGQTFLHPALDFRIEFPVGWTTMNAPQAVGAVAQKRDGLVFVGVLGKGTDPEQIGRAFANSLAEEFGARPSRSESVEVGPLPGYLVTLTDDSGSEPMHMHFLWVACRGLIYQMIGLAPERYRDTLRRTALSFRPLTGEERSSIKQIRLRIVAATDGERLRQLSKRTGNVWDLGETAIANGIDSTEPLGAGQLIKIAVSQTYEN